MKGLFLTFGLVIALFVSDVRATIYDGASSHAPKTQMTSLYCTTTGSYDCALSSSRADTDPIALLDRSNEISNDTQDWYVHSTAPCPNVCEWSVSYTYKRNWLYANGTVGGQQTDILYQFDTLQSSCPPDTFPNYVYGIDSDGDGVVDQCYNPNELDNLSDCSSQYNSGSMLLVGSNTASTLCKTDSATGARCAYTLNATAGTSFYTPNLEISCFGDSELPEYNEDDPTSQPPDEQCSPYASGFVCSADPKNYCDATGACVSGCGYVNDQFVCFRDQECTGDQCAPAPVNCTTTPDAPVCKDQPDNGTPTFCDANPTAPTCQAGSNYCKTYPTAPSCQTNTGGGGGSSFQLDYERLIQGMKDAAKTLIDETPAPDFSDTQSAIDEKQGELDESNEGFLDGQHFSDLKTQVENNNIFNSGLSIIPTGGGCTPYEIGGYDLELCAVAEKIRPILFFVFSVLTFIYLKNLFYRTVIPAKG